MMTPHIFRKKKYVFAFIVCLNALLISGCVGKKNTPNPSLISMNSLGLKDGRRTAAKAVLKEIEAKNRFLALELGRLPEFQDDVSDLEISGLNNLKHYYLLDPKGFDTAFEQMDAIGKKENRKYCTLLQAVFWLSMEYEFTVDNNPIHPYSFKEILSKAWTNEPRVDKDTIEKMVDAIQSESIREQYKEKLAKKNRYILYSLTRLSEQSPEVLAPWVPAMLRNSRRDHLWNNYDLVIDRLNSPEIVDYYVQKHITYSNYWEIPGYNYRTPSAQYVFKNKTGDCLYTSHFIVTALARSGYSAMIVKKPPLRMTDAWHAVAVFESEKGKFIIDDGKVYPRGIIKYSDY
ncbi:MAG: transglutaminase-like domain-containing protein [Proteobacteria bacterium]|nr:transglutaminase-like domain-containing protein [Pseudomonadota bacterium]MBU2453264.1 transglutaminase-like domain-containing protein [Pseudomonadota bacterium]MBU2629993.1 transglutaminase-like domain-containing protein [Pseudomonadota bacterium]